MWKETVWLLTFIIWWWWRLLFCEKQNSRSQTLSRWSAEYKMQQYADNCVCIGIGVPTFGFTSISSLIQLWSCLPYSKFQLYFCIICWFFFLKIFSLKKSLISHPQLTTPSQPMDTDTPKFSLLGVILRVHLETAYLTFAKNMLKYT